MLYTVIIDYKGGTYISQGYGDEPIKGMKSAIENSDFTDVPDLALINKAELAKDLASSELVEISSLKNVYSTSELIVDSLLLINVIGTNEI